MSSGKQRNMKEQNEGGGSGKRHRAKRITCGEKRYQIEGKEGNIGSPQCSKIMSQYPRNCAIGLTNHGF